MSSNNNVEWLFAFDVHCNSFVPLFVALYLGQLILSPLLSQRGFICALLSNILYGLSLSYYHYCQFVGFNSLPFLERTEFLLYPVVGLVLLAIPLSSDAVQPDEVGAELVFRRGGFEVKMTTILRERERE